MNQRRSRKTKRAHQPGYEPPPITPRSKDTPAPNVFFSALVVLAGIGGVLCLIGLGLTVQKIWAISEQQAILDGLPDVAVAAPGELATLDGKVSPSVPALHDEFVAYVRERHVSGKYVASHWPRVDGATQPLAVEADARTYTIDNDDYRFDRLLSNWTDARRWDEEATTFSGAIRIEGIAANGPVMAVGRLKPTAGPLSFQAETVVGVTRGVYSGRLAESRAYEWKLAGVLAVIAALGLYGGWRGVRRLMQ